MFQEGWKPLRERLVTKVYDSVSLDFSYFFEGGNLDLAAKVLYTIVYLRPWRIIQIGNGIIPLNEHLSIRVINHYT